MIGTGGIIVLDDTACMVDMARFLVGLLRRGIVRQVRALPRGDQADAADPDPDLPRARATADDLPLLERLAKTREAGVAVRHGRHGARSPC